MATACGREVIYGCARSSTCVKKIVLRGVYAFDIIRQLGMIYAGDSGHCASYKIVINADRTDVKAS